ncbi:MAG: hypothetical protein LBS54_08955 [Dysgonamonadaceae bacterium]|nr:hypothetical protein [Dysgonamonadaceae bacterium]
MSTTPRLTKSRSEAGTNTYVGNLDILIDKCSIFGPVFNPQNQDLQIESLKELSAHVKHSINDVDYLLAQAVFAEGNRQERFAQLLPTVTRVLAVAISLRLAEAALIHIREIVRKIRGTRAKPILPTPPLEGEEPKKYNSVSQRSFREQIEHLNQLILIVSAQPLYKPAEQDLSVDSLIKLKNEMGVVHDAATRVADELEEARIERDKLLYTPVTGMMDTALAVKEYVKAIFGAASPEYKDIKHLKFKNKKI